MALRENIFVHLSDIGREARCKEAAEKGDRSNSYVAKSHDYTKCVHYDTGIREY